MNKINRIPNTDIGPERGQVKSPLTNTWINVDGDPTAAVDYYLAMARVLEVSRHMEVLRDCRALCADEATYFRAFLPIFKRSYVRAKSY
jgi:hypothetical protein